MLWQKNLLHRPKKKSTTNVLTAEMRFIGIPTRTLRFARVKRLLSTDVNTMSELMATPEITK
mgnify:CR=1 FL=1